MHNFDVIVIGVDMGAWGNFHRKAAESREYFLQPGKPDGPAGPSGGGAGQKSSRNPRRGSIRQPKVAKNELPWVSTGE